MKTYILFQHPLFSADSILFKFELHAIDLKLDIAKSINCVNKILYALIFELL